jgi:hypothetical protein
MNQQGENFDTVDFDASAKFSGPADKDLNDLRFENKRSDAIDRNEEKPEKRFENILVHDPEVDREKDLNMVADLERELKFNQMERDLLRKQQVTRRRDQEKEKVLQRELNQKAKREFEKEREILLTKQNQLEERLSKSKESNSSESLEQIAKELDETKRHIKELDRRRLTDLEELKQLETEKQAKLKLLLQQDMKKQIDLENKRLDIENHLDDIRSQNKNAWRSYTPFSSKKEVIRKTKHQKSNDAHSLTERSITDESSNDAMKNTIGIVAAILFIVIVAVLLRALILVQPRSGPVPIPSQVSKRRASYPDGYYASTSKMGTNSIFDPSPPNPFLSDFNGQLQPDDKTGILYVPIIPNSKATSAIQTNTVGNIGNPSTSTHVSHATEANIGTALNTNSQVSQSEEHHNSVNIFQAASHPNGPNGPLIISNYNQPVESTVQAHVFANHDRPSYADSTRNNERGEPKEIENGSVLQNKDHEVKSSSFGNNQPIHIDNGVNQKKDNQPAQSSNIRRIENPKDKSSSIKNDKKFHISSSESGKKNLKIKTETKNEQAPTNSSSPSIIDIETPPKDNIETKKTSFLNNKNSQKDQKSDESPKSDKKNNKSDIGNEINPSNSSYSPINSNISHSGKTKEITESRISPINDINITRKDQKSSESSKNAISDIVKENHPEGTMSISTNSDNSHVPEEKSQSDTKFSRSSKKDEKSSESFKSGKDNSKLNSEIPIIQSPILPSKNEAAQKDIKIASKNNEQSNDSKLENSLQNPEKISPPSNSDEANKNIMKLNTSSTSGNNINIAFPQNKEPNLNQSTFNKEDQNLPLEKHGISQTSTTPQSIPSTEVPPTENPASSEEDTSSHKSVISSLSQNVTPITESSNANVNVKLNHFKGIENSEQGEESILPDDSNKIGGHSTFSHSNLNMSKTEASPTNTGFKNVHSKSQISDSPIEEKKDLLSRDILPQPSDENASTKNSLVVTNSLNPGIHSQTTSKDASNIIKSELKTIPNEEPKSENPIQEDVLSITSQSPTKDSGLKSKLKYSNNLVTDKIIANPSSETNKIPDLEISKISSKIPKAEDKPVNQPSADSFTIKNQISHNSPGSTTKWNKNKSISEKMQFNPSLTAASKNEEPKTEDDKSNDSNGLQTADSFLKTPIGSASSVLTKKVEGSIYSHQTDHSPSKGENSVDEIKSNLKKTTPILNQNSAEISTGSSDPNKTNKEIVKTNAENTTALENKNLIDDSSDKVLVPKNVEPTVSTKSPEKNPHRYDEYDTSSLYGPIEQIDISSSKKEVPINSKRLLN